MHLLPTASSLVVVNDDRDELIVCVEPWGFEVALNNQEEAKITIRANTQEAMGVRSKQGRLILETLAEGEVHLEIWLGGERIH